MADEEDIEQFPDLGQKLSAPKKLSAFERERQAAEAKRLRAEAENAAALREFEDSFAEGDDTSRGPESARGIPTGPRGGEFGGSRGGNGMPPRSGPGSLGPGPGMPPPPPSLKRKRALEEAREAAEARREQDVFGFADDDDYTKGVSQKFAPEEDEKEDETPKPTVQLSSIPPGTSLEELKAMLGGHLKVHSVRFAPPAGPGAVGKKSLTAITTLDSNTSASQIDMAVSALRDHYMGCGFYLSITRHLSSTTTFPGVGGLSSSRSTEPFGAQSTRGNHSRGFMRHAPPPPDQKGFAPPEYYERQGRVTKAAGTQVEVHAPLDIATVRAVHTISDRILAEDDPDRALELEALLMTLPEVQKDERFAFLYDSKSPAGVYYRFCLWGPDTVEEQNRRAKGPERIFTDMDMEWLPPHREVPFLDLTSLAQVTEHVDYDSSDEESDDDGDERRMNNGTDGDNPTQRAEKTRLTPLQQARFTRLLARLPTSNARLRQGDISRITNYVINHAGGGTEDFVDLLLLNIEKPFSSTQAAQKVDTDSERENTGEEDDYEPDDELPTAEAKFNAVADSKRDEDLSNAKLIALYIISDILSASSTAGARNAWKYRQLFEAGLRNRKTFERLGRLDRELGWGRLKADQWKRKIGVVFGIWESWSTFSSDVHAELKQAFFEPSLTEEEKALAAKEAERESQVAQEGKWMSKFKKVESGSASPAPATVAVPQPLQAMGEGGSMEQEEDVDGAPMDDVDGVPMDDVDGVPMDSVDVAPSGPPANRKPTGGLDGAAESKPTAQPSRGGFSLNRGGKAAIAPRKRMKAEDMFGDSDDE